MQIKRILTIWLLLSFPVTMASADSGATNSSTMTLDQAVSYALAHSPDLQAAQSEITRREGIAATARSGLLPQVDVFGDMNHTYYDHAFPPATSPQTIRFDDMIYTAGAELKFLVWDFGQTANELTAARDRIQAAQALQNRQKQEVIYTTAALYLKTLTYDDLINAAISTQKSLQSLLQQTTELTDAGRAVPADVLKVSTRLAEIKSDLATLDAGRQTSLSQLAAAIGWEGEPPRLQYEPPEADFSARYENADTLISKAFAQRPDLRSQESEIDAAIHQETAARSSRWPRAELQAGAYEYAAADPVSSLGNSGSKPDSAVGDLAVGLHISMPLFDAGRRSGQIQTAAAQTELARTAERKLRLNIAKEVRSALADIESAQKRVQATQESVVQAKEVLRNEKLKYAAGRSVINFVLDAEATLLTHESLLRQAQRSMRITQLVLDLDVGNIDPAAVASGAP
jgi:outer membrane protein TolC